MDTTKFNDKAWYRALKVIFIFAFLLTQLVGFAITNAITSDKVSFIHCDNGKEFKNPYFLPDDQEKLALFKQCDITAYFFNKSEVKGVLTDAQRQQLDTTILQMRQQGKIESEIQTFVDDFKTQYAVPNPDAGTKYTQEEVFAKWGHTLQDSFKVAGSNTWIANYKLEDKDKYSFVVKLSYYVLSFLIISILFWIISRVFFYIFAKEKFFRLPLR